MSGDIGGVPRKQEHECCAERAGQEGSGEEPGFVLWDSIRIQTNHQPGTEDGGEDGDKHREGSIAPFIREPANGEHADGSDGAGGRGEHEGLLGGVAEGGEENGGEV